MKKQKQEIENIKIGVIDSGIDPRFSVFLLNKESEWSDLKNINLRDTIIQKTTPLRKNGHEGHDHKNLDTLDIKGHGTKCASVAAARKTEIKLHNTIPVSIEGAAPSAKLYIYKVSWEEDSHPENFINAFKAAIKDKVDVISISMGPGADTPSSSPYHLDPIAVGSFLAMKANILTVAACGNFGHSKIKNVAPWILTVGASESKKKFKATVEIGGKEFVGSSLNPSNTILPLRIFPTNLKSSTNLGGDKKSQDTHERFSKDKKQIKDHLKRYIVLCTNLKEKKQAEKAGAGGILYQDGTHTPIAEDNKKCPSVLLTKDEIKEIRQLICNNPKGTPIHAKICRSKMVDNQNPFIVPEFSSRGPNPITNEILKPDICAPGVEICVPSVNSKKINDYTIVSGTSFACPYVAGKAAIIKKILEKNSIDPTPAAIKSALITTAYKPNNEGNIFAEGAGFLDFERAMNPGLVYDCGADEYANCFLGEERVNEGLPKMYKHGGSPRTKIKPYELNYPSITVKVPKDGSKYSWRIPRRLKYVGTTSDTYEARITGPSHTVGIEIKIEPSKLHFNGPNCEEHYTVVLNINKEDWPKSHKFYTASLEWSPQKNKHQCVKSPFAIIGEEKFKF